MPVGGATMTANFQGGQLNGSGGCNTFNTTYQTNDGFRLLINPLTTTQIACDQLVMDQENQYFTHAAADDPLHPARSEPGSDRYSAGSQSIEYTAQ